MPTAYRSTLLQAIIAIVLNSKRPLWVQVRTKFERFQQLLDKTLGSRRGYGDSLESP